MIGGYLYQKIDEGIQARLQQKLARDATVKVWDLGFFFFNHSDGDGKKPYATGTDAMVLSEDLLIRSNGEMNYRSVDLGTDFLDSYRKDGSKAFSTIQNDFRMAVVSRTAETHSLQLVSHRAGAGRMYYHRLDHGILFSSDLRFLFSILPLDVNPVGVYAILKYGSIPEPLTISRNISAVPAAHFLNFELNQGKASSHPFFKFQFDCRHNVRKDSLDGVRASLKKSAALLSQYPSAMLLSGGIDSSLYGCYLNEARRDPIKSFYCAFGLNDPEYPYAEAIARKLGVELKVATMGKSDALQALDDIVRLSDHPFSDFSSLPIVFLLKYVKEHLDPKGIIIECNGGDDCFGFSTLGWESKYRFKHAFPKIIKKTLSALLGNFKHWKWETHEGLIARVAALADAHETSLFNYFLVQAPVHYMGFNANPEWDDILQNLIEQEARDCSQDYNNYGYEENITVRQLLYINSPRWTAKALSISESLGLQLIYPFIWKDILLEQGRIPWDVKINHGIVKWPLKKLLEEFMPPEFIYRKKSGFVPPLVHWLTDPQFNRKARDLVARNDGFVSQILPIRVLDELFTDALNANRLRAPLLNTLWGAIFTEAWIQEHGKASTKN